MDPSLPETMEPSQSPQTAAVIAPQAGNLPWWNDRRLLGFAGFCLLLTLAFFGPLQALVRYTLKEELHSHVLLIPIVSLYLAWQAIGNLPTERKTSLVGGVILIALALGVFLIPQMLGSPLSANDDHSRWAACYALMIVAGGFLFLGNPLMRALAFPFAFLVFMIPLPYAAVVGLESWLMRWSAEVSHWFFMLSGTPVFRDGQVMELPGTTLEVAPECSGIRSTFVLFITSLLASYMLLKSPLHRYLLVGMVIPLGIIRNGLRVLVIGLLCVHKGPHMIDSWIHHKGGPVFFGLSLVPLLLMILWFHRREARAARLERGSGTPS
jgi:exosortase C (VPDSG-CTERM-specific)